MRLVGNRWRPPLWYLRESWPRPQLLHCRWRIKDHLVLGVSASLFCFLVLVSHHGEGRLRALSAGSFDFSWLSLQRLLHSCLVPCYVCKRVSSSVFPMFVLLSVSGSQSVAPRSASLAPGNRLEIRILGSTLDLLNLKLVVRPRGWGYNKAPQWFGCTPGFGNCSSRMVSV